MLISSFNHPTSLASAHPSSITCNAGLGGQVFSAGVELQVEILPFNPAAIFTSEIYFLSPGGGRQFLGTNRDVGQVAQLGTFLAGTELIFEIFVLNTGDTFRIGPALRNPDGIAHAIIECVEAGKAIVSFEDLFNGGDLTYNDVRFQITSFMDMNIDSDGDGLPDDWEINGYIYNGTFVDLPSMGANPNHKDIFIEIDYMTGHRPRQTAIDMIRDAFARVPNSLFAIPNPDGADGITLHVNVDDEFPHADQLGTNNGDGYNWTEFEAVKLLHFDEALSLSHHYCLFIHNGPISSKGIHSGIARNIPSSDFIISLGNWSSGSILGIPFGEGGTTSDQAGTFMHELGHNLGLRHGGFEDLPHRKPNYLSVMNYSFQLTGLHFNGSNGLFDYSRFDLPQLNEANLDEHAGLSGGQALSGYGTSWFCGSSQEWRNNANGPINWNCNKNFIFFDEIENSVSADINNDGMQTILRSYNDWANINFRGGLIGSGIVFPLPIETPIEEIDIETARSLLPSPPSGLSGKHESCVIQLNWMLVGPLNDYSYRVYRSTGGQPFTLLTTIDNASVSDSSINVIHTYSYYVTTLNALGSESNLSGIVTIKGGFDLISDLITRVLSYNLDRGFENSLLTKLNGAKDALSRGQKQAACQKMQAFINEVNAQSGKKLTVAQANQLRTDATNIRLIICCP
jgi:hypothetical protein